MSLTDVPERTVPPIAWEDWTPAAFSRAQAEGRPVLLSISANWCHGCAVMDHVAYGDPRVADLVAREFVPVRVDADRRPDINDRYNLDGWPTTALLTPSGEILTGSTYLPADALLSMLHEVATAYREQRDALDRRAEAQARTRHMQPRPRATGVEPDLAAPAWVARQVIDQCDPDHGGFGADGKFLHVPALQVAIAEYERAKDESLGRAITRTLDGMADGDIRDQIDGGFFRYASVRDWSRPHTEKLLDDQAGMVSVYLEAARVFAHDRWREIAVDTIRFVRTTMAAEGDAVFFASLAADDAYYEVRTRSLRKTLSPPRVDRTSLTDATARAASVWIRAGALLHDPVVAEIGARALDRIVTRTYLPGQGLAHWLDGEVGYRGLLTDQVFPAAALLELHEATGNPTFSMLAEELMRTALRTHWDEATGAFTDRVIDPADVGQLRDPANSPAANAMAARALARLSRLTGDPALQDRALDVLRALTPASRQQGLFGATYALAILDVLR
jgi:uncharacterized protein YyaL (SSP411 family)